MIAAMAARSSSSIDRNSGMLVSRCGSAGMAWYSSSSSDLWPCCGWRLIIAPVLRVSCCVLTSPKHATRNNRVSHLFVGVQQDIVQMILPDTGDFQILSRSALVAEPQLLDHPNGARVPGHDIGLDPMQLELLES